MKKIVLNILIVLVSFSYANFAHSGDKNLQQTETELNLYTGMFDFSDGKQASALVGLQHQNDELFRDSFLGKISPVTGGFITEKSAFYLYTGAQAEYDLGSRTQYKVRTLGGKEMAIEKLREDRYRGQINDEVRIGWDYEQTHTF